MNENDWNPWRTPLEAAIRAQADASAARYAQLATVRLDGRPANRTVVVRGILDAEAGLVLLITTDARSPKFAQVVANDSAELCWYFAGTREQFRLLGRVSVVAGPSADPLRAGCWAGLPEASRRTFLGPAPGTSPRADVEAFRLDEPAPEAPPDRFALLVLHVEEVDHLDLRPTPHERVRYRKTEAGWAVEPLNP